MMFGKSLIKPVLFHLAWAKDGVGSRCYCWNANHKVLKFSFLWAQKAHQINNFNCVYLKKKELIKTKRKLTKRKHKSPAHWQSKLPAVSSFKKTNEAQNRKHLYSTIQNHSLLYTACCSGTCLSKITWGN